MTLPRPAELYLDELAQFLAEIDPVDRIEIVGGIREHIVSRLEDTPDVDTVLQHLGSPDAVARQAVGEGVPLGNAPGATPSHAAEPGPALARSWVRPVVVVLQTLMLLAASVVAVMIVARMTGLDPAPTQGDALGPLLPEGFGFIGMEIAMLAVSTAGLTFPLWLPALVLLWASPLWHVRTKVVGTVAPWLPLLLLAPGLSIISRPLALVGVVLGIALGLAGILALSRKVLPPRTDLP